MDLKRKPTNQVPVKAKIKRRPVVNQVTLDVDNPIPFEHSGRSFSFINNTQYIPFLGSKDQFAQDLLEARLLSTTHNACITTKSDYIGGDGFHDIKGKEIDQGIKDWFDSINMHDEDITEVNKKILEGYFTQGNIPIQVKRSTFLKEKKVYVYAHNFLEWRLAKPNKDGIITHAIQSKLFVQGGYVTADDIAAAVKLPIYNSKRSERQNWLPDGKGSESTLIWFKNSVTGFPHYGLPDSVAAMIFEILEYKGARFNLDNFENNMVVSALMTLKGNLSQGEANRIGKDIIRSHTGDGKRGRVMVVASEEGIDGSDLHNFATQKEGSYGEADDKWTQKIILAHKWDAMLAGIISPSTLGKGAGFLTKIHEIKQLTVINPAQKNLIKKVWRHIFKICQEWTGLPFDQYEWDIKNSIDISGLTDVDVTPAVQVNEVRLAKGLPEDPRMKGVYMSEMKARQETKGEEDPDDDKDEEDPKKKKPTKKKND